MPAMPPPSVFSVRLKSSAVTRTHPSMRDHFFSLVAELTRRCQPGEHIHCYFMGECSDFIRFNHGRVRLSGQVVQYEMQLALVQANKHCLGHCDLSGDADIDLERVTNILTALRRDLPLCPDDPYLNYNTHAASSDSLANNHLPPTRQAVADIIEAATGMDLVGHYAAGEILRGFANSHGQRNWHSRPIFNFDWSCYDTHGHASKQHYTGTDWQPDSLAAHIVRQQHELTLMQRSSKSLCPGHYRTFLAPAALAELLGLASMGGFSLRDLRTRQSPLLKLAEGGRQLSTQVDLTEDRAGGMMPRFSPEGFELPARVDLVTAGKLHEPLVDARSAREYQQSVNTSEEAPQALQMGAGTLAGSDILNALDTGLYINNLWYGNFSDTNNCRITGMTRYACFWVEKGVMQAPLEVMRFDDSLYRLLGDQLAHITAKRTFLHDPDTYERRSLASMQLPGIICDRFTLTL